MLMLYLNKYYELFCYVHFCSIRCTWFERATFPGNAAALQGPAPSNFALLKDNDSMHVSLNSSQLTQLLLFFGFGDLTLFVIVGTFPVGDLLAIGGSCSQETRER